MHLFRESRRPPTRHSRSRRLPILALFIAAWMVAIFSRVETAPAQTAPAAAATPSVRAVLNQYLRRVSQPDGPYRRSGARHSGPEPAGIQRGCLGARHPKASVRFDAARRQAEARRRHLPCGGKPARERHRSSGGVEPQPGPDQHGPSPESHRVPQRGSRSAGARHRRVLAALRRHVRHRFRQQRGCPLDRAGATRALPVGGAEDHAPRHGSSSFGPGGRIVRRAKPPACRTIG